MTAECRPPEERPMRMHAYYYAFAATGERAVDVVLSAVACAGKAYHHTDNWSDDCEPYEEVHRGGSCVDWIQNAANDAASAIAALRAERDAAVALLDVPEHASHQRIYHLQQSIKFIANIARGQGFANRKQEPNEQMIGRALSEQHAELTTLRAEVERLRAERDADAREHTATSQPNPTRNLPMPLNLYLVSQTENNGYDTYDSFICAAESETSARAIHPNGPNNWGEFYPSWASSPDHVTVELIGTAPPGVAPGIIIASFNAG